jgi:hypothetical protein
VIDKTYKWQVKYRKMDQKDVNPYGILP